MRRSWQKTSLTIVLFGCLLVGLPIAVWLDLRSISSQFLTQKSEDIGAIIDDVRAFYTNEILPRVNEADGRVAFSESFRDRHGAIPIPATFSIELSRLIKAREKNLTYEFVSDYPFDAGRREDLDAFQIAALQEFRAGETQELFDISGGWMKQTVRMATPVRMSEACVGCHNSHPDSPKKDWVAGDIRGIQSIEITETLRGGVMTFKYLIAYFLFAAGTGFYVLHTQRQQNRALSDANSDLQSANIKLQDDLEGAREFQESMLPNTFPRMDALDYAAYFMPVHHVGGDFFDVFPLPEGRVGFVMADVAGKGVRSAFFAAITHSTLQAIVQKQFSPAKVLSMANDRLVEQNPLDLFATALYGIIDLDDGTLCVASCGHPNAFLRRADGSAEPVEIEPCLPLGSMAGIEVDEKCVPFEPGDVVCVFTDGVTDAGIERSDPFGEDRLLEVVRRQDIVDVDELKEAVRTAQLDHSSELPFDDAAFLAIGRRPAHADARAAAE